MLSHSAIETRSPPARMPATFSHYVDATPLLDDPAALRARAAEDGFLFLRGLLPREAIIDLRRQFLTVLDRHGWLRRDTPFMDGIVDREAIEREDPAAMIAQGVGIHSAAYAEVQKLEAFHALAHHPRLIRLYQILFDAPVLPHPRHIARLILPASFNKPTPPHQDFIHIQGTRNVWTCWIPMGDCPRPMGNLTMVRGSHRAGLLTVAPAEGAGGLAAQMCGDDHEWVEGDFEAGDVVTFPSLTIHKALPPEITDRVRLSCDFRFQPAEEEIEQASLLPHGQVATWDEIYAGWTRKDIQYYWRDRELVMGQWDDSIRWQKEKIC